MTDAHYEEAVKVGTGLMGATVGALRHDLERLAFELGRPDDSSESATIPDEMLQVLTEVIRDSLPANDCHRLAKLLKAPEVPSV